MVICDRFADSTRLYQGLARADLRGLVDQLHDLVIGQDPDLTVLIDMDPEIGLSRALARGDGEDRFESFGGDMQRRLRQGFLELAREFSERFVTIDGNRPVEEVFADMRDVVGARLP